MTSQEKARFFHQFAALLNAGISVERSLNLAGKDINPSFQRYLTKVAALVAGGEDLASAIASDSRYFDGWTIALIRLAEYSGSLSITCGRLATSSEVHQRRERLYRSVRLGLIATTWSLLLVVAAIFNQHAVAPLHLSFWLHAIGLGLLLVGLSILASRYRVQGWQRLGARVPGFRKIMQARSLLDFAELELPLSCGVPILTALDLVRERIPDPIMAKHLAIASRQIRSGNTLSHSLQGKLPPLALQMIRTGEETGNLDAALQKLAEYYESELERALRQLEGILRPLSILAIGALVLLLGIRLLASLTSSLPG